MKDHFPHYKEKRRVMSQNVNACVKQFLHHSRLPGKKRAIPYLDYGGQQAILGNNRPHKQREVRNHRLNPKLPITTVF